LFELVNRDLGQTVNHYKTDSTKRDVTVRYPLWMFSPPAIAGFYSIFLHGVLAEGVSRELASGARREDPKLIVLYKYKYNAYK